jgi:predicted pyridoxine 5'-phosphate oxidase superfamily flavin-nucleotide-binding protein
MRWHDFEREAPGLARRGRRALQRPGIAILATLRHDGSPRISPIEPFFVRGHLVLGLMLWSAKARDLEREPRCELHNAVRDVDASEGEFTVQARAFAASPDIANGARGAWWRDRPNNAARVMELDILSATFITWSTARGRMYVTRWRPGLPARRMSRPYP